MKDSTPAQILPRILALETERGFKDSAVTGGMDAYLSYLVAHSAHEIPAELLRHIDSISSLSRGYAGLDATARARWVAETLKILTRAERVPPPTSRDFAEETSTSDEALHSPLRSDFAGDKPGISHEQTVSPLQRPVTVMRGISTKTAGLLARLGVHTVDDLLHILPRRYIDFTRIVPVSQLHAGLDQTVVGRIERAQAIRMGQMTNTQAYLRDATGEIRVLWFNQPWLARQMSGGRDVALSGQVRWFGRSKVMESPEWEPADASGLHTGRLVPVYPLTRGLSARSMRKWVAAALEMGRPHITEYLPASTLERRRLAPLHEAIPQVHFPDDLNRAAIARRRLAFDELLALQLGLAITKRRWQTSLPGRPMTTRNEALQSFLARLPYTLTTDQEQVIEELNHDLARAIPMARLLQGDVGSGKTVVALYALLVSVTNGYQGALMAPTEVLAEQHFKTCLSLLSGQEASSSRDEGTPLEADSFRTSPVRRATLPDGTEVTLALLLGSLTARQRAYVRDAIRDGVVDIAIGTQALVQSGVEFESLGLAIVDEQHRFGVSQRGQLRQKGFNPHFLVMTATPIPRSLALAMFGDLDLSTIRMFPAGRQVIDTHIVSSGGATRVYEFIRRQVANGRQAYVVCPLIEESDNLSVAAATEEYEHLSNHVFPDLKVGLLHGGLRSDDKERIMRTFRDGGIQVLVTTTVIEVGVDVPNATVMVIQGAERFGLSQLHQLRGRVGRGEHKSYCILMTDTPSGDAVKRLKALQSTRDGFALAEKDLELRGPGDFLGTQQSGLPELRVATLTDLAVLEIARDEARRLIAEPGFEKDEQYRALRNRVEGLWRRNMEWS